MITLQKQPTPVTCVQACIAMCLDEPVNDVIEVFGGDPMNKQLLMSALTRCGVVHNAFTLGTMVCTGWYFAVVPSLNIEGGTHQVLVHADVDTGKRSVLDPSTGRTYDPDGSTLRSWSDLVYFLPGGRLDRSLVQAKKSLATALEDSAHLRRAVNALPGGRRLLKTGETIHLGDAAYTREGVWSPITESTPWGGVDDLYDPNELHPYSRKITKGKASR